MTSINIWHTSCRQYHARKEYKCAITGKKISIGELYCRLRVIEKNKREYNWTIKLDAFTNYKEYFEFKQAFYNYPELTIKQYNLNTTGYSLGFFN